MDARVGPGQKGVTRREAEVLHALADRLTNREIAERHFVSERTVESHVSSLLRKLGARNRLELSTLAASGAHACPERVAVPLPPLLDVAQAAGFVGPALESTRTALAAPGERRVVWLRGAPGIGKSRLLTELGRVAHGDGTTVVLHGRCDEALGAPYQAVREALRHWILHVPRRAVEAAAGPWLPQLSLLVPEAAPGGASIRSGDGDRFLLFEAVDSLLSGIGATAHVVLLIDDVHWADRSTLLLLRHIARSSRAGRVAIVGTYRDTDVTPEHPLVELSDDLDRQGVAAALDVAPLGSHDMARLLDDLAVLPSAAVPEVVDRASGNPFFAIELARHLADGTATGAQAPHGIRALVRQRLRRLRRQVHDVLAVASVIGPEVGEPVVAAAGGIEDGVVGAAMADAVRAHVLEEVPGSLGRYRFTHDLLRQAIVEELTCAERIRIHWATGRALAACEPEERAAIAHHLAEGVLAGDVATAVDALLAAAHDASRTAAWEAATAANERCLELLDAAGSDDLERRYQALMSTYRGHRALGEFRPARVACDAATVIARRMARPDLLTEAALGRTVWRVYRTGGGTGIAPYLELIDEALDAVGPGDSADRAMLVARRSRVLEMHAGGEEAIHEAVGHAETSLAMAQRLGDLAATLEAHDAFAQVVAGKVTPRRYLDLARSAVRAADRADPAELGDDIVLLTRVTNRLAAAGRLMAYPRVAEDGLRRLRRLVDTTGMPHTRSVLLRLEAGDALARGHLDEAERLSRATAETCPHDLNFLTSSWDLATMAAVTRGDLDRACTRLQQAIDWNDPAKSEIPFVLSAVLAASGDADGAAATIDRAMAGGIPWTWGRPRALWAAAETAARLGDAELGRMLLPLLEVHRVTLLSPFASSCTVDGSADTSIGQLQALVGDHDAAGASFTAGLAREERMGYEALAARTRLWWARTAAASGARAGGPSVGAVAAAARAAAERLGLGLIEQDLAQLDLPTP